MPRPALRAALGDGDPGQQGRPFFQENPAPGNGVGQQDVDGAAVFLAGDQVPAPQDGEHDDQHGRHEGEHLGAQKPHTRGHVADAEQRAQGLGIGLVQGGQLRVAADGGIQGRHDEGQGEEADRPAVKGAALLVKGALEHRVQPGRMAARAQHARPLWPGRERCRCLSR